MKKLTFYILIFACFLNCQEKQTKSQTKSQPEYKNYIFLEYYENMSEKDFEETSKKLMDQGKIRYFIADFTKNYRYISGGCEVSMKFDFTMEGLLRSVTLENAGCILDSYVRKYEEVDLKEEKINLISYLGYNNDYDPNSTYTREGAIILCDGEDRTDWLDEFKIKIENDPSNDIIVKRLKNNPTEIRKEKVVLHITEKQEKIDIDQILYSLPYSGNLLSLINNNISKSEYVSDVFNGKESPRDFYNRTRSRYVAIIKSKYYYSYNYDITYQTTWNYDNQIEQLNKLNIESDKKDIEFKKKQEQRKNSSFDEI